MESPSVSPSSAQLALTDIYPPTPLPKLPGFKRAIENKKDALWDGRDEDSYLSFSSVTPQRFKYIENESRRNTLGAKLVRFTYFADIETLIAKVPSGPPEEAQAALGYEIYYLLRTRSGIGMNEVMPIGATTCHGKQGSSKEPNSSYRNNNLRPQLGSWPSWVVEGGMSDSMQRLRADASWWINHSDGKVQLVILILVRPNRRTIKIETWTVEPICSSPGPVTRARANRTGRARKEDEEVEMDFSVDPPTYRGPARLVLQFSRLVGRPPIPPREGDVVLTRQVLLRIGRAVSRNVI
jgi:hypothetical protein